MRPITYLGPLITLAPGQSGAATAECLAGYAVGGGYLAGSWVQDTIIVTSSYPIETYEDGAWTVRRWSVGGFNSSEHELTLTASVLCLIPR